MRALLQHEAVVQGLHVCGLKGYWACGLQGQKQKLEQLSWLQHVASALAA